MDSEAWDLLPRFFNPWITYMAMISPSFSGTFKLAYDSSLPYTFKTQYYLHATFLGSKDADFVGNDQDNCFGPNAGLNNINGASGTDVVLFLGKCVEYSFSSCKSTSCSITDSESYRNGVTHTSKIKYLSFSDGDYNVASASCTDKFSDFSAKCWELVSDLPLTSNPNPPAPPKKPKQKKPGKKKKKKKLNGEKACEGHGYNQKKCEAIGCCHWDNEECWSSVGKKKCKKKKKKNLN